MADGTGRPDLDPQAELSDEAAACEAVLFATARPLTLEELARCLDVEPARAAAALEALRAHLERHGHGIQLAEVAEGFQLVTRARYFGALRRAAVTVRRPALSPAALETLAIVAYRQPVSRSEIEALRGVDCEAALNTLLERGLIEVGYRATTPGRPAYYRTTRRFLELFGLRSLSDLPPLGQDRSPDGRPTSEPGSERGGPARPGMGGPRGAKNSP